VDRELIGGPFSEMNLIHSYASFATGRLFLTPIRDLTVANLEAYADRFNIKWVIATTAESCEVLASLSPFVTQVNEFIQSSQNARTTSNRSDSPFQEFWQEDVPKTEVCFFELASTPDYFFEGSGRVVADLNRISVSNASRGRIVLKYHWLESLKTDPELPLRRFDIIDSPVGFIEVENGDIGSFDIVNSYDY